jgi:hypothetical protein
MKGARCLFGYLLATLLGVTLFARPVLANESDAAPRKRASEKIVERVARGAITESLETLDQEENRERIGRILGSPQLQQAMRELVASIVTGVFEGVRAGKPGTQGFGRSMRREIDRNITPAVARMTYQVVDSAVSASTADKHIAQIEKLGEGATRAVVRGAAVGLERDLGPAIARTMDKDIGPALAVMISRDILPAIGRGLDTPEMQSAVANLTRSVATELVGGAGDAMQAKTDQNLEEGKQSRLQLFGDQVARGYDVAMYVSFAFGTLLLVLTIVLVRMSRRQRRQAEASKRRETALMHLIETIESDHPEIKSDLLRVLQDGRAETQQ